MPKTSPKNVYTIVPDWIRDKGSYKTHPQHLPTPQGLRSSTDQQKISPKSTESQNVQMSSSRERFGDMPRKKYRQDFLRTDMVHWQKKQWQCILVGVKQKIPFCAWISGWLFWMSCLHLQVWLRFCLSKGTLSWRIEKLWLYTSWDSEFSEWVEYNPQK